MNRSVLNSYNHFVVTRQKNISGSPKKRIVSRPLVEDISFGNSLQAHARVFGNPLDSSIKRASYTSNEYRAQCWPRSATTSNVRSSSLDSETWMRGSHTHRLKREWPLRHDLSPPKTLNTWASLVAAQEEQSLLRQYNTRLQFCRTSHRVFETSSTRSRFTAQRTTSPRCPV